MKAIGSRKVTYELPNNDNKDVNNTGEPAKNYSKAPKNSYTKSLSYSNFPIHRFQIFYCSDMNKTPGLFARSKVNVIKIFFSIKD